MIEDKQIDREDRMAKRKLIQFKYLILRIEDFIMMRLVPKDAPSPVFKWFFKIPILFYKIGLPLFGNFVLLLTTTGRKSGKLRHTPLEYRREQGTGYIVIMAGWGGNTDWRRNIQANHLVHVQVGWRKFDALAEALSDIEIAAWLLEAMQVNPMSARIWSRWAGEPVSIDKPDSVLRAAKYFPSFRLKPVEK
jgi:deazaflavin-dependent oxidoreductase (nitroreductase family)